MSRPGSNSDRFAGVGIRPGGLFRSATNLRSYGPEPSLYTSIVELGDVGRLPFRNTSPALPPRPARITGSGTHASMQRSELLACAEAIERYCAYAWRPEQFVWATAHELADAALDLDLLPQCSRLELLHPKCPLRAITKHSPMRWVHGLSLTTGRPAYVPAVIAFLQTGYVSDAERISLPISTGCAAHETYERAVVSGILEVVERDAISLLWLQQLALPEIVLDKYQGSPVEAYWREYLNSSADLEYRLFDATTDLGIPVVYGLQLCPDRERATIVSCSAATDAFAALEKVLRDMTAVRLAFRTLRNIPAEWDDFREILDGATYMARVEQRPAFEFLLRTKARVNSSQLQRQELDPAAALQQLMTRLRSAQMDVFVVDLTTDEAIRAGMRVVRVIIPGLQPLSFHYRARFLAHSRLYSAPEKMGYPVLKETELNPFPQPFA